MAVIGAGVSGLSAARRLDEAGVGVAVFDKGRRPGGRLSSRSLSADGEMLGRVDHGAQFFTARDERFRAVVHDWLSRDAVAEWQARIVYLGKDVEPARPATRYVGSPSMRALGAHMARGLEIRSGVRVAPPRRERDGWRLASDDGHDLGAFDTVVVTAPAPQTIELLVEAPVVREEISDVELEPCWAVLVVLDEPLEMTFDAAFVRESPLSWIAHDGSKPGRGDRPTWVLHASPDWSRRYISADRALVRAELEVEFARIAGVELPPVRAGHAHRWLYALPRAPLAEPCVYSSELSVGACGDWCGGPRVEGAFLSGLAIADRILEAV